MPGATSGPIVVAMRPPRGASYSFTPRVFAVVMPATGEEVFPPPPTFERLLEMAPSAFLNSRDRYDVNNDGRVSAIDALTVINHLARGGPLITKEIADAIALQASLWVDVNGDKDATASSTRCR